MDIFWNFPQKLNYPEIMRTLALVSNLSDFFLNKSSSSFDEISSKITVFWAWIEVMYFAKSALVLSSVFMIIF